MRKIVFLFLFLAIAGSPAAYAQDLADQKLVEVNISKDGRVSVTHVIGSSDSQQQLELVDGTISNLSATDEDGNEKQVTMIGDDDAVLIPPSQTDSIINYELEGALEFRNDYWTLEFLYLESTRFFLPDGIESFYINDSIVELGDKRGIVCHGCQMILQYSFDEPRMIQNVKWEEQEFDVEIVSHLEIDNFVFDQPGKSLTFDISEGNKFLTITIPLELLWEPYTIFLDDEQIKAAPFSSNGTHVSLFMKPETSGEINVVGTTVVPEFSVIAPLAAGFLMLLVLPFAKRSILR